MIINYLISIISGASLTLAFAPFRLWPVSFFSLISLIWIFSKQKTTKHSFYIGFLFGLGFFATSVSWVFVSIYKYGNTSLLLALGITSFFIIFLAIFPGLNLYLLKKFKLDQPTNWRFILAFPASWVLLEIFRSWFLTGFPWALLGYTQLSSSLKHYAAIFGVYGVSAIVAFISVLLINILFNFKNKYKNIIIIILIFLTPMLYKQNCCITSNYNIAAIIQGNIAPNDKFLFSNSNNLIKNINDIYFEPTKQLILDPNKIDLIIWPENSVPLDIEDPVANNFVYDVHKFAKNHNIGLLLGIPVNDEHNYNHFYNSVLALGTAKGIYYKINLVPFGDYVPFQKLLRGMIKFFNLPLSSFRAGSIKQPAIIFNKHKLLATVCYDIAYAENLRIRVLTNDPQVIVAVSEDGWFGDSLGPQQHLDIARMRAIETGRYILRATTSGVSAIIDNYGNIVKKSPMFDKAILVGEYNNGFKHTIWNKLGNKFIIVFLLICWFLAVYKINKNVK